LPVRLLKVYVGIDRSSPAAVAEMFVGSSVIRTMSGKTVTRADLCEAVCQKVRLSRTKSATLVELVLKEITDCLERGETVKLSSFGLFVVRKKGQRMGRNPRTGEEAPISPRRVVVFKPSAILKQRINAAPASEGLQE
jgi:integration host factor subunit alpha